MEDHHPQQIHPWVSKPTLPPNDKSRPFLDSTSPSTYLVDPSTTVSTLRPVVRSHGDPHSFNSGSNTNSRASLNLAQTYFKAREDHVLEKHDSISKLQNSIFCVSFSKSLDPFFVKANSYFVFTKNKDILALEKFLCFNYIYFFYFQHHH